MQAPRLVQDDVEMAEANEKPPMNVARFWIQAQLSDQLGYCNVWDLTRTEGGRKKELTTGKFLPKFVISEHRKSKPEVGEWICFYKKPIACGEKKKKKDSY